MVLFADPNGSGKTTLYYEKFANARLKGIEYINPDEYAKKHGGDMVGGRLAIKRRTELLKTQTSFVTESTLAGKSPLRLLDQAKKAGFQTTLIYIGTATPNLNITRVKQRARSGGHDVKSDDIIRRYHGSIANLASAISKADISHVYSSNAVTRRLFSARDGSLRARSAMVLSKWVPESIRSALLRPLDRNSLYNEAQAARETIKETAGTYFDKIRAPLQREQQALQDAIKDIRSKMVSHDQQRPGLFGKKAHEKKAVALKSDLTGARKKLRDFERDLPNKQKPLRKEAKEYARQKHPEAAEKIKQWKKQDRAARDDQKQSRTTPTRSR